MTDKPANNRLDVGKVDRTAYLVKVPRYVAESWKAAAQAGGQGAELARIRLAPKRPYEQLVAAEDPTEAREGHADESGFQQRPSFGGNYVLQLTGNAAADMPHTYRLQEQARGSDTLFAFQEGKGETRVVARIQQRYDTAVLHEPSGDVANGTAIDPKYRALARARQEAATRKRTMQVIDNPKSVEMQSSRQAAPKAKKADWERKVREDKGKLETRLFRLFEKQTHWKLAELQKHTDQPVAWLKEVLAGLASIHKQGPYMGTWQLKKAYTVSEKGP